MIMQCSLFGIISELMAEARLRAGESIRQRKPVNWTAGVIILLIWLALAAVILHYTWLFFRKWSTAH
jgi:hypothetical protein